MACAQSYSLVARLRSRWQQFAQNRRGAAAVEFALIAAPFFFLIFGLLEVCLIFIMSTVMEHAVSEAARPLRTGEAQQAGMTDIQFRQALCSEFFGILECDARFDRAFSRRLPDECQIGPVDRRPSDSSFHKSTSDRLLGRVSDSQV